MKELILFPTEIGIFEVPDAEEMNHNLVNLFIDVEDRRSVNSPGTKRKGYDLWRDPKVTHSRSYNKLKNIFEENCKIYARRFYNTDDIQIGLGWINLNSETDIPIPFHHHYNGVFHVLVGIYYPDVASEYGGNYIKILDPRYAAAERFQRGEEEKVKDHIVSIPIKDSQMIFLPEYLYHAVDYKSGPRNRPRVSIATNFPYPYRSPT
jgi:hypothetical protein